jgi:HSP20 family protein
LERNKAHRVSYIIFKKSLISASVLINQNFGGAKEKTMTNLIRWTPFGDLDRIFDEEPFLPMVNRFGGPATDLYETEDAVVAEVSVPGIDPKNVNVEIENNVLHVRAEQSSVVEDKGKDYYRKEVRRGAFARSFGLPAEVDAEKVKANYEKGILKIEMPKTEKAKPKKISVDIKE